MNRQAGIINVHKGQVFKIELVLFGSFQYLQVSTLHPDEIIRATTQ
jgi:hypothetical protein